MRNKYFVGLIQFLLMPLVGYAQTDISFPKVLEMSPNAASIAQYQDCPVSYYSGTPEISIPLYEIDVDGFKLPITLSYHASGIRVAQEASWVGLGWALNVGGTISRTIKNFDDFYQGGYDPDHLGAEKGYYYAPDISNYEISPNLFVPNIYKFGEVEFSEWIDRPAPLPDIQYMRETLTQRYDSEPDIFFYNLPSFSGKFIFDKKRKAVLFNKAHNLIFEPHYDKAMHCNIFTVKDGQGNKYIFKNVEKTENYREKRALNANSTLSSHQYDCNTESFRNSTGGGYIPYEYISCWCLSEIVTNKNRHIRFYYEEELQLLPAHESSESVNKYHPLMMDSWEQLDPAKSDLSADEILNWKVTPDNSPRVNYYTSKTVNKALRLVRIEYDFGTVRFEGSDRFDIKTKGKPSKKLDCISIRNSDNKHIKDITFDYDYFNPEYEGKDYDYVFMRLKLKSILDSSLDQPYVFSYNEENKMPAKNSNNTDYWGYYNGRKYGSDYYTGVYYENIKYPGVKKDANPEYTGTYTLTGIKYPTGGNEIFEYEVHKFPAYFYWRTNDDKGSGMDYPSTSPKYETKKVIYVDAYNNAGIGDWAYEQYPSDTTITFEIKANTFVDFTCTLDCVSGEKDKEFNYSNYLGILKNTKDNHPIYIYNEYPLVYEHKDYNGGIGSEIRLTTKRIDLEAGTYTFYTGSLPKEVHAEWRIDFDNHTPPIPEHGASLNTYEYGGGLRIKSIYTDMKKRSFSYSSGKLLTEPILSYLAVNFIGKQKWLCLIQPSESKTPMSTFCNGYAVGYDCVTENTENDDCPSYTKYYYKNEGEYELQDDNFPDGPVNINYTDGLLEKKEVYMDDILIKENEYDYISTSNPTIKAIYDRKGRHESEEYFSYYYNIKWPKLSKEVETLYDVNDENKKMAVTKTFKYNDHDLVSEEQTSDAISSYRNIIYYPFDFAQQQTIYKQMTDSNAICTPVEIVRLKDDAVIGATRANYQKLNNMFLIRTHDELDLKVPTNLSDYSKYYSCKETFDYFDNYGKLRQYRKSQGKLVTYLWGYNYLYPIAQIENMNYTNVAKLLGGEENVHTFLSRNNPNDSQVYTFLSPLMSVPNTYTNIYTYSPLIGMTSKVDVNGNKTYFKYNANNQLSSIKDNGQNIVQKFEYNYKK